MAAGSADGKIHIIQRKGDDTWTKQVEIAHDGGVNAISWGPPTEPSMLSLEHSSSQLDSSKQGGFTLPPKRFVSGGIDGKIKFWYFKENKFVITKEIPAHEDWIRDVSWSNNIGLLQDTVASCSEDQKVKIWKRTASQHDPSKDEWNLAQEININTPAWKVSWSQVGNMLAVSGGDNQVMVMKESANGEWATVSKVNEEGVLEEVI